MQTGIEMRRRVALGFAAFIVAVLGFGAITACAGAAQFYRLSCTTSADDTCLLPNSVNDHDQVVGDYTYVGDGDDDSGIGRAGFWQITPANPGGIGTELTATSTADGDEGSDANVINDSGQIAGTEAFNQTIYNNVQDGQHAVRWASPTSAPQVLGPIGLQPDSIDQSTGASIDAAGDVVGTTYTGNTGSPQVVGFKAVGSTLSEVGTADFDHGQDVYEESEADAITPDGSHILGNVQGSYSPDGTTSVDVNRYYLWSSPSSPGTQLNFTPGSSGSRVLDAQSFGSDDANALASDGTVLGYTGDTDTGRHYLLRLPTGTQTPLSGLTAYNAVNAKHQVVGDLLNGDPTTTLPHAALLQPDGTVVDLNSVATLPAETTLVDALAINDNGDVAGVGVDANGEFGFLLKMGYVVDSTGDQPDAAPGDGACLSAAGTCTLRAAIQEVNADASSTPTQISFAIPSSQIASGTLATIAPASALPALSAPVQIDATGQSGALTAGTRKIGVIIDGTSAGSGANGIELGAGAGGSTVQGLQVQNFSGDGIKVAGANSQIADSVLATDKVGVEVAASNVTVGAANNLPGDVFFHDGDSPGLFGSLASLSGHNDEAGFAQTLTGFGAGVLLTAASTGTSIQGDLIGVHGAGFSAAPDNLGADDASTFKLSADSTLTPFGVLVDPNAASVTNLSIGGAGADANTISGDAFGIGTFTSGSGAVSGLSLLNDTVGLEADGTSFPLFGNLFGLFVSGNVSGLQIGASGVGNTFADNIFGATLGGTGVSGATIQNNTFGDPAATGLPTVASNGLGKDNIVGLSLGDIQNATVGGTAAQANQLVGNFIGLTLAGQQLSGDVVSNNTIGITTPSRLGALANADWGKFGSAIGVLYQGNAAPSGSAAAQNLTFANNAIQGSAIGLLSDAATGMSLQSNTFTADALGVIDGGGASSQIGAAGAGNVFTDDGFGLLLGNASPTPTQDQSAQVNQTVTSNPGREGELSQPDEDVGFATLDALTSATLDATAADPPTTIPGRGNTVFANRFGVDGSGNTNADSLPVIIAGNEQGVQFGGLGAGQGNTVAHNRAGGVWLLGTTSVYPTVQILNNTIYDNENFTETNLTGIPGLGIDLATGSGGDPPDSGFGFGINPQDQTQPDAGADNDQNAPVITEAQTADGQLTVGGTLHGVPNTNYLVEVFADDNTNPFGAGEGQTLLGRPALTTDGSGNATFSLTVPVPSSTARFVSATATTQPGGGGVGVTSEFAVDAQITAADTSSPSTPASSADGSSQSPSSSSGSGASSGGGQSAAGSGNGATSPSGGITGGGGTVPASQATITLPAIVTCSSAASGNCTVTASATVVVPRSGHRISSVALAKARPKTMTEKIGAGRLVLKRGKSGRVAIRLTAAGLKLLKKDHALAVTVTYTVSAPHTRTVTKTVKLTLKYRAPPKRKHAARLMGA